MYLNKNISKLLLSAAKQVYPFAVSFKETIRSYTQTCSKISDSIAPLISSYKRDVQHILNEGLSDYGTLSNYFRIQTQMGRSFKVGTLC